MADVLPAFLYARQRTFLKGRVGSRRKCPCVAPPINILCKLYIIYN